MLSNCIKILMICVSTLACSSNDCNNLRGLIIKSPKSTKDLQTNTIFDNQSQYEVPKQKRRCCPYDFDSRICRTVGDRLLCGYNKNIGKPPSKDDEIRFNGCRIRGGRLECGYRDIAWTHGPYTNPRRPLPHDTMYNVDFNDDNDINKIDQNQSTISDLSEKTTKNPHSYGATKCVEIDKRIVCRPI